VLAAVFFAALSCQAATAGARPDYSAVPGLRETKERMPAPDFTLVNPEGRKVSLRDFRGKVVFLNFWATWCESCRDEMPAMERLYREFGGRDFEIIGVNVKDRRPDAVAFVKKLGVTYPILFDPQGEVGVLYGAFGMPLSYLIDRNGIVIARLLGPADWYTPGARKLIKTVVEAR
jgi:DsbE subfamily thiol:disulfide oxidoreductase